jgi:hypothetical protein
MTKANSPSAAGSRRRAADAASRHIDRRGDDHHPADRRWPPWLSILFILVSSLALWALIIRAVRWVLAAD